jgi:3-oxoacyl-[acyl-carrier protein] reductase
MDLKDKVAIVTGGAGGIGEGICRVLASRGAKVVVNHIKGELETAKRVVNDITANRGYAMAIEANVTNEDELTALVERTIQEFGALHILVNCAGITIDGTAVKLKKEDFEKVLAVNLTGAFLAMKAALPHMISQQYGRIISISSVAGLVGWRGSSAYAASKAGLIALSKSVAREVARKGITVNVIAPGYINAGLTKGVDKGYLEEQMKIVPMAKMGLPEDIGAGIAFLASDDAGYVTGEVLRIDGGMAM